MLGKGCIYYVSKSGKLSSGHRTRKDQLSFQPQRRATLHSFHMLTRLCSKSFKPRFSSMWNENFQTDKLGLEKAEEPEIKLPTFVGSWRKQVSSRKIPTFASLMMWKLLSVWITKKLWKILKDMGISDHLTCLLRNLYVGQYRRHRSCGFNPWVRKVPWRRPWHPTPVYLLGESCGQRSLVGYRLSGGKQLGTTEVDERAHTCIASLILPMCSISCWEEIVETWLYLYFCLFLCTSLSVITSCFLKLYYY